MTNQRPNPASLGRSALTPLGRNTLRSLTLLLSLSVFALTGCLRFELGLSVNEDGSGVLRTIVAMSDEFTQSSGIPADEVIDTSDFPAGATVTAYQDDGYTGFDVAMPFADLSEMTALLSNFDTQETGATSVYDVLELAQNPSGWQFTMTVPPFAEQGEVVPDGMLDGTWFRIRVALPGEIADHNADRVEDGAFVWDMDLAGTTPRELTASTTTDDATTTETADDAMATETADDAAAAEGDDAAAETSAYSNTTIVVVLSLIVLIAALGGGWVVVRRRR